MMGRGYQRERTRRMMQAVLRHLVVCRTTIRLAHYDGVKWAVAPIVGWKVSDGTVTGKGPTKLEAYWSWKSHK